MDVFRISNFLSITYLISCTALALSPDSVRIAYFEQNGDQYQLKLSQTGQSSGEVELLTTIRYKPFHLTAFPHADLLCWFRNAPSGMICFNKKSRKSRSYKFPPAQSSPKNLSIAEVGNGAIVGDHYGNNVYWLDCQQTAFTLRESCDLWVMSLRTSATKALIRQKMFASFAVDDTIGVMISWQGLSAGGCCRFGLTDPDYEQVACNKFLEMRQNNQVRILVATAIDPGLGLAISASANIVSVINLKRISHVQFLAYDYKQGGTSPRLDGFARNATLLYREADAFKMEYYDSKIYYSGGYIVWEQNIHSKEHTAREVLLDATHGFAIFEDKVQGWANPCESLQCSHLCLPWYPGQHVCTCPEGMNLVDERQCKWVAILTLASDGLAQLLSPDGRLRCSLSPHPPSSSSSQIRPCSNITVQDYVYDDVIVREGSNVTDSTFRFDPFAIGFARLTADSSCIEYCMLQSRSACTIIVCAILFDGRFQIERFDVDFFHGQIVWVQKNPTDEWILLSKSFASPNQISTRILGEVVTGLCVDPFSQQVLLASSSLNEEQATLWGIDYNLEAITKLRSGPYHPNSFGLEVRGTKFLRYRRYKESSELWLHDYQEGSNTRLVVFPNVRLKAILTLPPKPKVNKHPCWMSPCLHSCFPTGKKGLLCGCPKLYEPLLNGSCATFDVIIALISRRTTQVDVHQLATLGNQTSDVGGPFAITGTDNDMSNIVITLRPRNDTVEFCWVITGKIGLHCKLLVRRVNVQDWYYPQGLQSISENTTELLFDQSGDELIFNNGNMGSFSLISHDKVVDFPQFEIWDMQAWTLDVGRKIFFWAISGGRLCFKVLYDRQNPSCTHKSSNRVNSISAVTIDAVRRHLYVIYEGLNTKDDEVTGGSNQTLVKWHAYEEIFTSQLNKGQELLHDSPQGLVLNGSFRYLGNRLFWVQEEIQEQNYSLVMLNLRTFSVHVIPIPVPAGRKNVLQAIVTLGGLPETQNPCLESYCDQICLPATHESDSDFQCRCGNGYVLNNTGGCVKILEALDYRLEIAIATISILVVIVISVIGLLIRRHRKEAEMREIVREIREGNVRAQMAARNEAERSENLPLDCILPPADLFINHGQVLGRGAFSQVLQGVYLDKVVAVKSLKPSVRGNLMDFAREVKVMLYVGKHPHIVELLGVEVSNIRNKIFYAVLEYSPCGSLLEYLRKKRDMPSGNEAKLESSAENALIANKFIDWAHQIAEGMNFLTEKLVVHGDLAARNVLIFPEDVLKISDFGLSKRISQYGIYKKKGVEKLPFRWMAIESLENLQFSTKSDVWSYGITLWEMFSFGQVPFVEHGWNAVFKQELRAGLVPVQPDAAPSDFYNRVMRPCWNIDARQRPDFKTLRNLIRSFQGATEEENGQEAHQEIEYEKPADEASSEPIHHEFELDEGVHERVDRETTTIMGIIQSKFLKWKSQ